MSFVIHLNDFYLNAKNVTSPKSTNSFRQFQLIGAAIKFQSNTATNCADQHKETKTGIRQTRHFQTIRTSDLII